MEQPRPIEDVMDAILNIIPKEGNILAHEALANDFNKIRNSARYMAPEGWHVLWMQATEALQRYFPLPAKEEELFGWQRTVMEVFNAERDYKEFLDG